MVMPIYYAKDCLVCHGEPEGDLDISGYPKEGHKEGDLVGAITVPAEMPSEERPVRQGFGATNTSTFKRCSV